ncbi:uncharacterized protein LOC116209375 isoform X2 [Punica granatum]|uniref:Uncharacterized protein n=2 Tax=Punica granatum TaxID=22663 RepID=A0A2I0IV94_PUNGR|nr:uncharacterized protein LOC116209375 isoform X2 [Punica granatum]PKI47915.1 hypothetical protein CRG98_031699 [Punica granatum]
MGEVGAAASLGFCINGSGFGTGKLKLQQQQLVMLKNRARCPMELTGTRSRKLLVVKSETGKKPSSYTSKIATDIPLYEAPGASFDQYLEDKPRVFKAIFPDKRRSQRLNEEEWRIQMLPIQFLFLKVWPQIDMRLRCRSMGKDYPAGVPHDVSKVLELDIIRWELQGLDNVLKPSHFSLGVRGALYAERREARSRLKGVEEIGGEHEA